MSYSSTDSDSPSITSEAICDGLLLRHKSQSAKSDHPDPSSFLQYLIENRLYVDASKVLSRMLSARQGVWWACLCVEHVSSQIDNSLSPAEENALRAAAEWVQQPSDAHLAACTELSGQLATASSARSLCRAVECAGSSEPPFEQLDDGDPEGACAAVARVALIGVTQIVHRTRRRNYLEFLRMGIEVYHRDNGWSDSTNS